MLFCRGKEAVKIEVEPLYATGPFVQMLHRRYTLGPRLGAAASLAIRHKTHGFKNVKVGIKPLILSRLS
jgi:hypothetical protein